jgi:small subunit ribosomal protein S4e
MHLKRNKIGTFWPIPRKGNKYIAVPSHNLKESIPLIVVIRDILGLVKTKKELKKAINEKKIRINQRDIRDTNYPISLFDILTVSDKNYRVGLSEKKKIFLEEVSQKDAKTKTFKVLDKKVLKKNNIQVNLMHGKNLNLKEDVEIGDSVIFDFDSKKITKIIKMKEGNNAFIIKGKHAGQRGKIEEIIERGNKNIAKMSVKKNRLNVWTKNIVAIE